MAKQTRRCVMHLNPFAVIFQLSKKNRADPWPHYTRAAIATETIFYVRVFKRRLIDADDAEFAIYCCVKLIFNI